MSPASELPTLSVLVSQQEKIYTKEIHEQGDWELQLPPAFQDFSSVCFSQIKCSQLSDACISGTVGGYPQAQVRCKWRLGDTCDCPCPPPMTTGDLPPTFPTQSDCYVNAHHHPIHHSLTPPGCGCYVNSLPVASTPRRKRLEGLPWKPCCPEASIELVSSPPFFPQNVLPWS